MQEFLEILKSHQIELLVDIRSFPGSRRFPQFNKENLASELPSEGIKYEHIVKLGGRRKAKPDSKNTAWRHSAFRGYADYMETDEFKEGMDALLKLAVNFRSAIMCSEAVWWSCHRSLVSDYLKSIGITVLHIMDKDKTQEHPYTRPARIVNGKLSYEDEFELKF
jgi:uncharacterized protein (DUF488 family)